MIPKIVHQQAPRDLNKWHRLWFRCSETWHTKFWDHDYRLWDDETLDAFVKKEYPQYYESYISFPLMILKVDFCRPLLLHKFGGIYADLDYLVVHNFREYLDDTKINIVESPVSMFPSWQETIQNSLMASPPNCQFWLDFCDYSIEIYSRKEIREELEWCSAYKNLQVEGWVIKATTGPIALTNFCKETNADIHVLPKKIFNPRFDGGKINGDTKDIELKFLTNHPKDEIDPENLQGVHLTTGNWGI